MWTLDLDKTDSINDSAFIELLVGTHDYTISKAELRADKNDPSGKTFQLYLGLNKDDRTHSLYLHVMSTNDMQRMIANKTVKGICDAVGFSGQMNPERLKKLVDKKVRITTTSKPDKDKQGNDIIRINVKTVESVPVNFTPEPTPEPAPEPVAQTAPAAAAEPAGDGVKLPWEK